MQKPRQMSTSPRRKPLTHLVHLVAIRIVVSIVVPALALGHEDWRQGVEGRRHAFSTPSRISRRLGLLWQELGCFSNPAIYILLNVFRTFD